MSHHVEQHTLEGVTYNAGDLWQAWEGAWGTHLILGFTADGKEVKLARPYAYASSVGSTGPTVLSGVEVYVLPTNHLKLWTYLGGGFRT